jgi:hypothetical protein
MAQFPFRNRRAASAAHFALVAAILAGVFVLTYAWWYPKGLFMSARGFDLFLLIAATNLVVGPLLTFIVYVPGKKGLAFDLAVIAVLQAAALAYGLHVLHESRPVFLVFVKDRFELVRANGIPQPHLERARSTPYAEFPIDGPRLVGALLPLDPAERQRIVIATITTIGLDLHHFPHLYVPYDAVRPEVRAHAASLARLRELNPGASREIDRLVAASGLPEAALGFLPMRAGKTDLAAIIDLKSGDLLHVAALRPWTLK